MLGQRRPQRTAGLKDYPACDEEVRRLAGRVVGRAERGPPSADRWARAGSSAAPRSARC